MGDDHFLTVSLTGYIEKYKRLSFDNIQGIIIVRTIRGRVMSFILAGIMILGFLPAFSASNLGEALLMSIMGFAFLIFLVINLILGPTSRMYVKTSVQSEHIASVTHLRKAIKVANKMSPLILAAQSKIESAPIPEEQATL
ncbi:MAG: hypothetical protein SGI71_10425 [Verrucomicrobiota bacterium]|nr:hypothetical protein [Verrucomicrobiota bacterium]